MTLAGRCEGVEFESVGLLGAEGFSRSWWRRVSVSWTAARPRRALRGAGPPWPCAGRAALGAPGLLCGAYRPSARLIDGCKRCSPGDGARQVVLLSGEPGIGKTRLSSYAAHRAHAEGFAVVLGRPALRSSRCRMSRGSRCARSLSSMPLRELLAPPCRSGTRASSVGLARNLERHIMELARATDLRPRDRALPSLLGGRGVASGGGAERAGVRGAR